MIARLLEALGALDPQPTAEEMADALWLAQQCRKRAGEATRHLPTDGGAGEAPGAARETDATTGLQDSADEPTPGARHPPTTAEADAPGAASPGEWASLFLPVDADQGEPVAGRPVRVPGVRAIRGTLTLSRSLRPLRRREGSRRRLVLDEEATAASTAEARMVWPEYRRAPERWLDLAVIVDESASMAVWQRSADELHMLLERLGAFRDIRVWAVNSDRPGPLRLALRSGSAKAPTSGRNPRELIDPTGRRIFIVVSDCIGAAWAGDHVASLLDLWGRSGPVAILHPLPQRLWKRSAAAFVPVRLRAARPGMPNSGLEVSFRDEEAEQGPNELPVPIPVLELGSRWLGPWASLIAGPGRAWVDGTALAWSHPAVEHPSDLRQDTDGRNGGELSASERLGRFQAAASPEAFKLARYLAVTSLSLPVMRHVQQVMLRQPNPSDLAEVFLGGLLRRVSPLDAVGDPDDVEYEFRDGIRELLLEGVPRPEALRVLREVGDSISRRFGSQLGSGVDFRALLAAENAVNLPHVRSFATVAASALRHLGIEAASDPELRIRASDADAKPQPVRQGEHHVSDREWRSAGTQPSPMPDDTHPGEDVTSSPQDSPPLPSAEPAVMRGVPPRNPHFTGREDLLERLRIGLTARAKRVTALLPQAIHGLGGVGKTQLASEYAYRHANDYDLICWIPSEQSTMVRSGLAGLASQLKVAQRGDIAQTTAAVLDALRRGHPYRRWLLVFDNAEQPDEIIDLLRDPSGDVLITSRNQHWTGRVDTIEVDVFEPEESIGFLQRRVKGMTNDDAGRLAEKLGNLPLAIEQAAAWHVETGKPVETYLRLLDERLKEQPAASVGGYPPPVIATWDVSITELRRASSAAVLLLELCAFFGSETIPHNLLWLGRNANLPSPLRSTLRNQLEFRRALRPISRYALARVDTVAGSLQVHRLVQAIIRERLTVEEREATRHSVHELLASANPGLPDDPTTWPRHEELFPHIIPSGVIEGRTEDSRTLVLDQIRFLYRRGDYEASRDLAELAWSSWNETLGRDDEQALIAGRHLAVALRALGDIRRAEHINDDTLTRMRRKFGDDHEHSLATANSYAGDLRLRGVFDEAHRLDEHTYDGHRRVFGDDDPQTLRVANNLAIDLRLLGDFDAARELDERNLRRRSALLRPTDTEILSSTHNLARDLYGLGDYKAARDVLEEFVGRFERALGASHPDVLHARRTLAVTLRKLGDYRKARDMAEENLNFYRLRLGERHHFTVAAMTSHMNDLREVGDLGGARTLGETALAHYRELLGDDHPFTHVCASNLAIVYRAMGLHDDALEADKRAAAGLVARLGEDHVYTLCCAANMSNDLSLAGEPDAAKELSEKTFELSKRARGAGHPYTLACALNLSLDLWAVGEDERAHALETETVAHLALVLGTTHPETIAAKNRRRAESDVEPPTT